MILSLGLLSLSREKPGESNARGGWIALAAMVGMIGQTSLVNTLCHLHTPVAIGLTRIGVGLALGALVGGVLWLIVSFALRRTRST
jgi:hypothetical protein